MTGTRGGYGMSRKPLRKRRERLFLFCMLILPFTQWLVFWLYVNFSSIILAFQDQRTGAWTFSNFSLFWDRLTLPDGIINIAVKNTMRYFGAATGYRAYLRCEPGIMRERLNRKDALRSVKPRIS